MPPDVEPLGTALTRQLHEAGFTNAAYVSMTDLADNVAGVNDLSETTWVYGDRLMIYHQFPFVSKKLIFNEDNSPQGGLNIINLIRNQSEYDIDNITELIESEFYVEQQVSQTPQVAAICHLYYPHTIFSFLVKLGRLRPFNTRFIFNLSTSLYIDEYFVSILNRIFPQSIVLYTTSQGRDIGGKLACIDVLMRCEIPAEYTLLIHDKLSPHTPLGHKWRDELLSVVQPDNIQKIFDKFQSNNKIGLIGAGKFIQNEYDPDKQTFNLSSASNLESLIKEFGLKIDDFNFIAGSIFWIRTSILKSFFEKNSPLSLRKSLEKGNVLDFDKGTNVHAWERLFSFLPNAYGYKIAGI